MANSSSHARQELKWTERFRYVPVSSKFQEQDHGCHISDSTQHEKWNILGFTPNLTTVIRPRPPRQTNIKNDKPWLSGAQYVHGIGTRGGDDIVTSWL
jgi:hypothetical protein